jgi:hypothetical protein
MYGASVSYPITRLSGRWLFAGEEARFEERGEEIVNKTAILKASMQ